MRLHMTAKEPGPGGIRLQAGVAGPQLHRDIPAALARRLRAAADGRRAGQPDAVHAPRRGRGGLGVGRADPRRLGDLARGPRRYPAGTSGPTAATTLLERDGRILAGVSNAADTPSTPSSPDVTERIAERSSATRAAYLHRIAQRGDRAPPAAELACANLAHGFAASEAADEDGAARLGRSRTSPSCRRTTTCSRRTSRSRPTPRELKKAVHRRPAASPSSPAACPPCATASPRAAPACSSRCSAAT